MPWPVDELVFVQGQVAEDVTVNPSASVIPLTPWAYDWAARRGLDVLLIDDVIDRRLLRPPSVPYLRWQLDWLQRVDSAASARGAVVASAHLIKPPLDALVTRARVLDAVVAALTPRRVTYAGPTADAASPWHHGHLQYWPILGDRPLAAGLLPLIVRDRLDTIDALAEARTESAEENVARALRTTARRLVGPLRLWRPRLPRPSNSPATLMLWDADYGAAAFARDQRADGRRVLAMDRHHPDRVRIVDLDRPWRSGPSIPFALAGTAPETFDIGPFTAQIDEWAGVAGAGDLFSSRLSTLVDRLIPTITTAVPSLRGVLDAYNVKEVAAANPSSLEEFATLLAAAGRPDTRRTLVQHGDHLFPYDFWLVTETQNFDHLLCSDPTVGGDLTAAAEALGTRAPICTMSFSRIATSAFGRTGVGTSPVVYVPTPMIGDSNVIDVGYFDDAWYHRWHLTLLDEMERHPDVKFIWKALPRADQSVDTIPDILTKRRIQNVEYRGDPFLRVLPSAARVITDFPSTGLYQAVRARVPTLAIVFPRFAELRQSAEELFRPIIRICDDEREAVHHVHAFLADSPSRWLLDEDRLHRFDSDGAPGVSP